MSWNYRVVHHRLTRANLVEGPEGLTDAFDSYEIHEVYYDDAGDVKNMTVGPMPVFAETVDGVRAVLDRMREALDKPVLEYDVETLADDPTPEDYDDHDVA